MSKKNQKPAVKETPKRNPGDYLLAGRLNEEDQNQGGVE